MKALLALPHDHTRALEADLRREYGVDLRDRWRHDKKGRRKLTLRQLASYVSGLPPDSLTAQKLGGDGLTRADLLLMDLYGAFVGKPHPARPQQSSNKASSPKRAERLRAAKRRAAARRRAIERGEIK